MFCTSHETTEYVVSDNPIKGILLRGRVSAASTTARWSSGVGSTDHLECLGRHLYRGGSVIFAASQSRWYLFQIWPML